MSVIMSFFVVLLILAFGDVVSARTKAFVPSVFVAALLFVLGFWYGWFPLDVVEKAGDATCTTRNDIENRRYR